MDFSSMLNEAKKDHGIKTNPIKQPDSKANPHIGGVFGGGKGNDEGSATSSSSSSSGRRGGRVPISNLLNVGNRGGKQKFAGSRGNVVVIGGANDDDMMDEDDERDSKFNPMHEIVPGVWVGAEEAAEDIEALKEHMVTHILALTGRKPSHESEEFEYLLLSARDSEEYPIHTDFDESIAFIKEALDNGTAVLVHCGAGSSRGPTVVIAYLIAERDMPYDEAFALVKSKRELAAPNEGFKLQLIKFAEKVKKAKSGGAEASISNEELLQKQVWRLKDQVADLEKQLLLARRRHEDFVFELWEEDYSTERKMKMIGEEYKRVKADKERERKEKEARERKGKEKQARLERLKKEREEYRKDLDRQRNEKGKGKEKERIQYEKEEDKGKGKEKEKEKEDDKDKKRKSSGGFVAFGGEGRRLV